MPPRNPVAYQALDLNDAITEHLPLVKRIAYQIASRLPPNVELDDGPRRFNRFTRCSKAL